jgi:hypothetical protein
LRYYLREIALAISDGCLKLEVGREEQKALKHPAKSSTLVLLEDGGWMLDERKRKISKTPRQFH